MAWLLRSGEVLASLDVVGSAPVQPSAPALGTSLRRDTRLVVSGGHDEGDLAWLDDDLVVRRVGHLGRFGLRLAPGGAHHALRAETGAFERWNLVVGDQLEIKD